MLFFESHGRRATSRLQRNYTETSDIIDRVMLRH